MNIGGWHDIFLKGTIGNFTGMRANAATADARAAQRLLVGPWNHSGMRTGNPIGSVDFGVHSTGADLDVDGLHLRWYDHWLRGRTTASRATHRSRSSSWGPSAGARQEAWPLPKTDWQNWYLPQCRERQFAQRQRQLSAASHQTASRPTPTSTIRSTRSRPCGGGLCCNAVFSQGGSYDQRDVEAR